MSILSLTPALSLKKRRGKCFWNAKSKALSTTLFEGEGRCQTQNGKERRNEDGGKERIERKGSKEKDRKKKEGGAPITCPPYWRNWDGCATFLSFRSFPFDHFRSMLSFPPLPFFPHFPVMIFSRSTLFISIFSLRWHHLHHFLSIDPFLSLISFPLFTFNRFLSVVYFSIIYFPSCPFNHVLSPPPFLFIIFFPSCPFHHVLPSPPLFSIHGLNKFYCSFGLSFSWRSFELGDLQR